MTSLGFNPSHLTINLLPAIKFMIVLLPTPVSPTTMMASVAFSSLGMAARPFLINSFSFSRFSLFYIVYTVLIICIGDFKIGLKNSVIISWPAEEYFNTILVKIKNLRWINLK